MHQPSRGDETARVGPDEAEREAVAAAGRAAALVVEAVDDEQLRMVARTGDLVWGARGTFASNELKALAHAGAPIHLALDRRQAGRPVVGFAVGFLGWTPVLHVHSHQVGVVPGERSRGVAYALKLAQRHTCLARGITDVRWTFDPLLRPNATFNLRALGARAASFHPDFYGEMTDSINAGDASDRLEAIWDITRPLPRRPDSGSRSKVSTNVPGPVLIEDHGGWPRVTDARPVPGAVLAVPADYEALRQQEPERAQAWRTASREVLTASYTESLRVDNLDEVGYRLARNAA